MATKAMLSGYKNKENVRQVVFTKDCESLKEIQESVEQAFDKDATTIVIKRIMPRGKGR